MVVFIKQNLKLFLKLISTDNNSKEISLSAAEFNSLRILFKVLDPNGRPIET